MLRIFHNKPHFRSKRNWQNKIKDKTMKRAIMYAVIFCMSFWAFGADASSASSTADAKALQEEVSRLKTENVALRRENQRLRAQLVERGPSEPSSSVSSVRSSGNDSAQASNGEYWLTTSSKKRHNSKCRYYKKSLPSHRKRGVIRNG